MKTYSQTTIITLHNMILQRYGGLSGIRDLNLLDAALKSGFAGFSDIEFYKLQLEKIAKISVTLIKNHPFNDGNKRTGIATMELLLNLNGYELTIDDDLLYELTIKISTGLFSEKDLTDTLSKHTQKLIISL